MRSFVLFVLLSIDHTTTNMRTLGVTCSEQTGNNEPELLPMVAKSISHHLETMVETMVGWYLRWGINRHQGFLGGA